MVLWLLKIYSVVSTSIYESALHSAGSWTSVWLLTHGTLTKLIVLIKHATKAMPNYLMILYHCLRPILGHGREGSKTYQIKVGNPKTLRSNYTSMNFFYLNIHYTYSTCCNCYFHVSLQNTRKRIVDGSLWYKPDEWDNDLDDLRGKNARHARWLIHQDPEEHFSPEPTNENIIN